MEQIPGYSSVHRISEDAYSMLYGATEQSTHEQVLLRRCAPTHRLASARLQRELEAFEVLEALGRSPAAQMIDTPKGQAVLLSAGRSRLCPLSELSGQGHALDRQLKLAVELSRALVDLHQQGWVHGALNPTQLRYTERGLRAQWVGLGALDVEGAAGRWSGAAPDQLVYMAPEVLSERGVAQLSVSGDLYSLGVMLYELFSGQRPFEGRGDTLSAHHHQLAGPLPSLQHTRLEVPRALEAIIERLLARSPWDRYQSATSAAADLWRVYQAFRRHEPLDHFHVGQDELGAALPAQEMFFGRVQAIAQLRQTYQEVAQQRRAQLLMLLGHAGVGKNRLVDDLWREVAPQGVNFLRGAFTKERRPYTALIALVRDFVQQMLMRPQAEIAIWRRSFVGIFQEQGTLLSKAIPELELLLGAQPTVSATPQAEEHSRVKRLAAQLITTMTSAGRPLILCIDHIEDADIASLELIEHMLTTQPELPVLVICIGRPQECERNAGLLQAYVRLSEQGQSPSFITLEPLTLEDTRRWLSAALSASPQETQELAQIIYQSTRGNPRHTEELLHELHRVGLIRVEDARWRWEVDELLGWLTEVDLSELWLHRWEQLEAQDRRLLQLAAGLIDAWTIEELEALALVDGEEIAQMLARAKDLRLLKHVEQASSLELRWSFVHEELSQRIWATLERQEQEAWRLRVGRYLWRSLPQRPQDYARILRYLNPLSEQLTEDERFALMQLNYQSAQRARLATAYELALEHIEQGLALLEPGWWRVHHEETMAFMLEATKVGYAAGRHPQVLRWAEIIAQHARQDEERSVAALWSVRSQIALGQAGVALEQLRRVLAGRGRLDAEVPRLSKLLWKAGQLELALPDDAQLEQRLVNLPTLEAPALALDIELMEAGLSTAFVEEPRTFIELALAMMELTLTHGLSSAAPVAFAAYALLQSSALHQYKRSLVLGKLAMSLALERGEPRAKAYVSLILGAFIMPWSCAASEALPVLLRGYREAVEAGDGELATYCLLCHNQFAYWAGVELPRLEDMFLQGHEEVERLGAPFVRVCYRRWYAQVLQLRAAQLPSWAQRGERAEELRDFWARFHGGYTQLLMSLHQCESRHALEEQLLWLEDQRAGVRSTPMLLRVDGDLALGWCDIALQEPHVKGRRRAAWRAFKRLAQLWRWGQINPERAARASLVQAMLLELEGKSRAAARAFDDALRVAVEHDDTLEVMLICTRAADAALARQDERGARRYMIQALHAYETWGAIEYTKALKRRYEKLLGQELEELTKLPSQHRHYQSLDTRGALKVAQILSQEIVFERLVDKLLSVLMELLGAQRGVFLQIKDQRLMAIQDAALHESIQRASVAGMWAEEAAQRLPQGLLQLVWRTGQAVVVDDMSSDVRYALDPYVAQERPRSALCWPVVRHQRVLGLLYLENRLMAGVFSAHQQELLGLLSGQIATSLENAILYNTLEQRVDERTRQLQKALKSLEQAATTDYLTGVSNRLHFSQLLQSAMAKSREHGWPLSLVLLDLDHFKQINDRHGHDAGDHVLVSVTQRLDANLREGDVLARWGGEEFIVLLPKTPLAEAKRLAQQLLQAVRQQPIEGVGVVSFSAGVSQWREGEPEQRWIKRADVALYRAKDQGRAQVCAWEDD